VTQLYNYWNVAAVFEWTIAFVYTWYVLSFFIDFLPAVPTMRAGHGDGAAESQQYFRGQPAPAAAAPHAGNGYAAGEPGQNFYPNANGYNNQYPKPEAPLPSRNF
jgi:hypothetical protein